MTSDGRSNAPPAAPSPSKADRLSPAEALAIVRDRLRPSRSHPELGQALDTLARLVADHGSAGLRGLQRDTDRLEAAVEDFKSSRRVTLGRRAAASPPPPERE